MSLKVFSIVIDGVSNIEHFSYCTQSSWCWVWEDLTNETIYPWTRGYLKVKTKSTFFLFEKIPIILQIKFFSISKAKYSNVLDKQGLRDSHFKRHDLKTSPPCNLASLISFLSEYFVTLYFVLYKSA